MSAPIPLSDLVAPVVGRRVRHVPTSRVAEAVSTFMGQIEVRGDEDTRPVRWLLEHCEYIDGVDDRPMPVRDAGATYPPGLEHP